MRALLVLKAASGARQTPDAIPTAATIKEFMAAPETVQEVEGVAKRLGFKVVNSSPLQVTIEGTEGAFERVFGTRPVSGKRASTQSVKQWSKTPELPEELRTNVTDVVLPQPTVLHK
jgi:subtilase family serine protease